MSSSGVPPGKDAAILKRAWWRIEPWFEKLNGLLVLLGPKAYIGAHWPWPRQKPYQRKSLILRPPGGGIGDELMCLPVFEEIKRRNPSCRITFMTRHPDFFKGHPAIDEVLQGGPDSPGLRLVYHHALPPPRPLMTLMAECVGMEASFDRIHPPPVTPSEKIRDRIDAICAPFIAVQPLASNWTTNKSWPLEYWRSVIQALGASHLVVEVGNRPAFAPGDFDGNFLSLAGETGLADFAYLISRSRLFIGSSSGGMHVANAYNVDSVIVFGGYEAPEGYNYPRTTAFYSPVPCAPCWRRTCPYDLKCLRAITPDQVIAAAERMLSSHPGPSS